MVWFDLWLRLCEIAFCWNIDELREPMVNPWELAIWQSEILRQMKSVTFEQSSPNVWGKKKNPAICCFFPWSRFPPTPSLESLPQIAFTQAFITQLKLCYCSWHSKWATSAKQFILAFLSRRIYGKACAGTNSHVLFQYGQLVVYKQVLTCG